MSFTVVLVKDDPVFGHIIQNEDKNLKELVFLRKVDLIQTKRLNAKEMD